MSLVPTGMIIDVKEIVDKHHQLIVRNIDPSDELMEAMKHYKVLTDNMIEDVKDSADRQDKVFKILDLVAIKGSHVMELFCDALQLSGHAFIADFIRDEINELVVKKEYPEDGSSNKFIDGRDIVKYLCGKFERMLHEKEKADLLKYLEKKFQAAVIKKMTKLNNDDKQKAITTKQHQIEQSLKFNEVLMEKDRDYQHMTDKLQQAILESSVKGVELKGMNKYLQELRDKKTEQLAEQIKFNNANDSSLRRLAKRTDDMERTCRQMMKMMEPYLPEPDEYGMRRDSFSSSSIDRLVSEHDKCKHSLKLLLPRISSLIKMKDDYMSLCDEREYVLLHIGAAINNHEPQVLRQAFQDFVVDKEATQQTIVTENVQLKNALQLLQSRFLTTGSKLAEVQEESVSLQKSREKTFIKDLLHKDTDMMALKDDRDRLLESQVMNEARIKLLEANLAKGQGMASAQYRIDADAREAHQSMNVRNVTQNGIDDGAPHPLAAPAPAQHPLAAPAPAPHPLVAPAPAPHLLAAPAPAHAPYPLAAAAPDSLVAPALAHAPHLPAAPAPDSLVAPAPDSLVAAAPDSLVAPAPAHAPHLPAAPAPQPLAAAAPHPLLAPAPAPAHAPHMPAAPSQFSHHQRFPSNKADTPMSNIHKPVKPQTVKNVIDTSYHTVPPINFDTTLQVSSRDVSPREFSTHKSAGVMHAGGTPAGFMHVGGTPAGFMHVGGTPAGGTHAGGTPAGGTHAGGTPAGVMPRRGSLKYIGSKVDMCQNSKEQWPSVHDKVEPPIAWASTHSRTEQSYYRPQVSLMKKSKTMADSMHLGGKPSTSTFQRKPKHE